MYLVHNQTEMEKILTIRLKQAGAELGQAQLKLGLVFTSIDQIH